MTKNKSLGYDRYVISDMFPIGILDMDTGDRWPLADEGIFETVCELLNKQDSENYQLKQAYADAKADVEKKEQILKDIMRDNLLIHDSKKGVRRKDEIIIKRFTYDSKSASILKDGEFWLDGQVDTACNHHEICEQLNLYETVNKNLAAFIESKGFTVEDVDEYTEKEIWGFDVK